MDHMLRFLLLCLILGAIVPVVAIAAEESRGSQPTIVSFGEDGVQRVTIVLDSYSYSPDHIIVQAGKPVELILTSITTITPHNFVLKDGASELSVERDVSAGKTLTVQFTPMQRGMFAFYCDKKLLFFASHREKRMEGKLEVR